MNLGPIASSLAFASMTIMIVGCAGSDPEGQETTTSPTEPSETKAAGGKCNVPSGTFTYALRDMEGGGHIAAYLAACGPQGNPAAMNEEIASSHLLGEGLGPLCEVTTRATSPDGCTFTYETTCREQTCTTEVTFAGDTYTGTVSCHETEPFPAMTCSHRVEGKKKR